MGGEIYRQFVASLDILTNESCATLKLFIYDLYTTDIVIEAVRK